MQQFFVLSRNASLGTFLDHTIIGGSARRELIPNAAVLSCHAMLLPVTRQDKNGCDGE